MHRNLREITIRSYGMDPTEERVREWHDLDRLLAGLWASHSIPPKIFVSGNLERLVPRMLPELTSRGVVCEVWMVITIEIPESLLPP